MDGCVFKADFVYATGIVKPLFEGNASCGRVRYLDLGFFDGTAKPASESAVLNAQAFEGLRRLRSAQCDKHLLVIY